MNKQLVLIIKRGLEQGLTPLALAHKIEKELHMNDQHLCRDCGQPMTLDMQEVRNAPDLAIVTCKNKACTLYSVTLSTDVYEALTEAQVQEYRSMVSNLKRTLKMRSE